MENIVCGVPQRSILRSSCFDLYINDVPLAVSEECISFADDAAFILTSHKIADLYQRIGKLLADITKDLKYNYLIPNVTKNKLMFFSSRRVAELPVFRFSGGDVEWVSEFRYLGLTLTNKLSYEMHISKVALNASRISGMIALLLINFHLEIWGFSSYLPTKILFFLCTSDPGVIGI